MNDFDLASYNYHLPPELIADRALEERQNSRLLVYHQKTDQLSHHFFYELPSLLPAHSRLVLNQSKVYPGRLLGKTDSGGQCELLLLSLDNTQGHYPAMIKSGKKKKIGQTLHFEKDTLIASIEEVLEDGLFKVSFNKTKEELISFLSSYGHIPIPPYIRKGQDDDLDKKQYQTVFAHHQKVGSIAAPTAGLHFTPHLFKELENKGISKSFVTLHVGMGTFTPVKSEHILDHKMHTEFYEVDEIAAHDIQKDEGHIIAVGTTSLRVLESSYLKGEGFQFSPNRQMSTSIFLHPGKEVLSVQGLITNFHLPGSTLIMLVSAILGREKTLEIYQEAIKHRYRFFSYGDALLILR